MTLEHVLGWSIPALALLVSFASFFISLQAFRRTTSAEKPVVWIELTRTSNPEWFLGTLNIKNRSSSLLQTTKLASVASDLREFQLGNYYETLSTDGAGVQGLAPSFVVKEQYLLMPFVWHVHPGDTKERNFLLFKASFSRASSTKVTVMMEEKAAKPKAISVDVVARF